MIGRIGRARSARDLGGCRARARAGAFGAAVLLGVTAVAAAPREAAAHPATSAFRPLVPCRLADTRTGWNAHRHAPDVIAVAAADRCGVPATAAAVAISIVAVDAPRAGYVAAYPAGAHVPPTSVLNYEAGQVRTNATVVGVSGGGFELFDTGGAHLVVDVSGYFDPAASSSAGRLLPITPRRAIDTRAGGQAPTLGAFTVTLPGVPDGASAAAVNVTVTETAGWGYVTLWPPDVPRPGTSVLNYDGAGQTRAVAAIMPIAMVDGAASIAVAVSEAASHVLIDVTGYFTGPDAAAGADGLFLPATARLFDSRHDAYALEAAGTREIPTPSGAAALLNVTLLATSPAWLRVAPAGVPSGDTSTVNAGSAGDHAAANLAVSATSARGVEVTAAASADVIVDLLGVFTGPTLPAQTPLREPPTLPTSASDHPVGRCDTMGSPGLASRRRPADAVVIGTSVRGRPIVAEYWGPANPHAVVLVVGQVHGNECAPALLVDEIRRNPPSTYGIWLIPTLNPDGYAAYTRRNANDVDLNADGYHRSQPETRALLDLTAAVRPTLTVHVHSPNGSVGWYGTSTYRIGNPAASGAPRSAAIAAIVAGRTGLDFTGAGSRAGTNWFLWQAQRAVLPGHEALLVELHAISNAEVPHARPRPATRSVADVRAEARVVLDALERVLG